MSLDVVMYETITDHRQLTFSVQRFIGRTACQWSRWRAWRRVGIFGEMLRAELWARAVERELARRLRHEGAREAEIEALCRWLKEDESEDLVR